ncbi:MAG: DNA-binding protein [Fimbriimonadaceae bacterium]
MTNAVYPTEAPHETLDIHGRLKLSFNNARIVAAALTVNCMLLETEDLQNGQRIDALKVNNPFS